MVRGRGSGGGGRLRLASATRRASATVSVRQIDGLLADSASKSPRPSRSTRLSRSAVTVAVRSAAGQEGDLADRLAGAQLGDRLAAAVEGDDEAAGDDDVEGVGRLALAHQDFAALEAQRVELGGQPRPLVRRQVVEDLDRVEAVLGGVCVDIGGGWLGVSLVRA